LNRAIFLWTEGATKETTEYARFGDDAGDGFEDGETEDGTEELRTECETCFQAEIDVGGSDCSIDVSISKWSMKRIEAKTYQQLLVLNQRGVLCGR
jgi:hypothetical protein